MPIEFLLCPKHLPTSFAWNVLSVGKAAFHTAYVVSVLNADGDLEALAANRAHLFDILVSDKARSATIGAPSFQLNTIQWFAAMLAKQRFVLDNSRFVIALGGTVDDSVPLRDKLYSAVFAFLWKHKKNLLSVGWRACLGHTAPTGGINNYSRLTANRKANVCPKPLYYSTSVRMVPA
jgi:hypothetical protein